MGSWPDAPTAGEVSAQANRACPALKTSIAPTRSAFSSKPHSTHWNRAWLSRFSLATWPQHGHVRLVFLGGTVTSYHPFQASLVQERRGFLRNPINGIAFDWIGRVMRHAPTRLFSPASGLNRALCRLYDSIIQTAGRRSQVPIATSLSGVEAARPKFHCR